MIGGYDKKRQVPDIYRVYVHENKIEEIFEGEAPFGIAFGGQKDEIQRIVFGGHWDDRLRLTARAVTLLDRYRDLLQEHLKTKGILEELPKSETFGEQLSFFKDFKLTEFVANWGDFSNQNAIECVSWFVGIMIKSHEFSSRLPTVGGRIQLGLITKDKGFKFISKEEYIHEGRGTPMED